MGANRDPRTRNQVDLAALKTAFPYQSRQSRLFKSVL